MLGKQLTRTMLGTPWWGLDSSAKHVPWKPGAANPLATELQFLLRFAGEGELSADEWEKRLNSLGPL